MNQKLTSLISKILVVLALFAMVFNPVSLAAAQSNVTYITSNDQLPKQGQLVIPGNVGWSAPAKVHGLVATIWYGGKDDNVSTMLHLSDGLASDRALKYGGKSSDYATVVWDGENAPISGGQNCRDGFYSDSVVLTEGVVYGDKCPIVIEYHIDHFVSVAPAATEPPAAAAPESANPPSIAPVLPVVPTTSIPGVPEWVWSLIQWVSLGCFGLLFAMLAAYAAYVVIKPHHGSSWAIGLAAVAFFASLIPCMWFLVMIALGIYSLATPVKTVTISTPPA